MMFGIGSIVLIGAWPARVEFITGMRYFARYITPGRIGGAWLPV